MAGSHSAAQADPLSFTRDGVLPRYERGVRFPTKWWQFSVSVAATVPSLFGPRTPGFVRGAHDASGASTPQTVTLLQAGGWTFSKALSS